MINLVALMCLPIVSHADGDLRAYGLENRAQGCAIECASAAGVPGQKYGIDRANDGNSNTWWASAGFPKYPIQMRLAFEEPVIIDTMVIIQASNPSIYSNWKSTRLEMSDGPAVEHTWQDADVPQVLRFEPRTIRWLNISILDAYHPERHYITAREIMLFNDPQQKVKLRMPPTHGWKDADVRPQGRQIHPCVYITPQDVERAKNRLETSAWTQKWFEGVRAQADEWVTKTDEWLASVLPEHGACFAYGFTGCPICSAPWGTWGGARCSFDNPGHVTCRSGHVLPDDDHPDPGTGYKGPDGRIHYFVGSYNAWVVETLQSKALKNLVLAYTLTGEENYAQKAAFILDCLADLYPSCDSGSWDYPSDPPSGRFCRPWYQVARVLIHYVDYYDQLFNSPSLEEPSIREGLSRRQNIELNLLQNGATYCYEQSLKGRLHNGEADYVRGSLAVGCCLGIPWYVHWAYDGPYGILSFVRNNVDRDGRYFETSASYANHTRNLYLTFSEPLLNWRSQEYPDGINLYDDKQFQSFYVLPELSFNCLGKMPRYGDTSPDATQTFLPFRLYSAFDYRLAERLYARVSAPADERKFASLLDYLSNGDPARARQATAEMPWILFHGKEPPTGFDGELDPLLQRRIGSGEVFGQKGFAFLRSGAGPSAQALLIRYGPTLNHGHWDDLNINYYALGHEITYDLGYGLGSTHTQVGWSRQTASHNLVLVDETSQARGGSGTGGSLHQFADLPGLKLAEVSSDNSYAQQGVSVYRRLVALVGDADKQYLLDIFRVVGGKQHDYLFHSIGEEASFEGVTLSEAAEGSLAGPEYNWGNMQLNDGDMDGYPGRPYWNPPPGNGLGFLVEPQRAKHEGQWSATWDLPGEDSFVRLNVLGQPGTEVITARAPGIYPRLPRARYAIARRTSAEGPLSSTFIAAIEPHGESVSGVRVDATDIHSSCKVSGGTLKYVSGLGVLLYKGVEIGDELSFEFEVPQTGVYTVALSHYISPAYGAAQLSVDGEPIGDAADGRGSEVKRAPLAELGQMTLAAGRHRASLAFTAKSAQDYCWFGVRALWLVPEGEQATAQAAPFIKRMLPVTCTDAQDAVQPAGAIVQLVDGARDVFITSADARRLCTFHCDGGDIQLQGRFAHLRFRGDRLERGHLSGALRLAWDGVEVQCDEAEHTGKVLAADEERAVIDVDVALPEGAVLQGQVVMFDNPRYSRNSAHRIDRVEAKGDGSRVFLESPTLVLGTGILEDEPLNGQEFISLLAHEYATSDSVDGTQFFSGKRIKGEGFQTNIIRTNIGQLMRYRVDSTEGMQAGAGFVVCDVQAGDGFTIPTSAHITSDAGGTYTCRGTTRVVMRAGDGLIGAERDVTPQ